MKQLKISIIALLACASLSILAQAPQISAIADAAVVEGGSLNLANVINIIDNEGDPITVSLTSISNEPQTLQTNNDAKQVDPWPKVADDFIIESVTTDVPGMYISTLDIAPFFGAGDLNGDGSSTYTVTVEANDGVNSSSEVFVVTVNSAFQPVSSSGKTLIQAESFANHGPLDPGPGPNENSQGMGVEIEATRVVLAFTNKDDFVEYKIDVAAAGLYQLDFNIGVPAGQANPKTTTITSTVESVSFVPASTTGFGNFQTRSVQINLATGQQTLRIDLGDPTTTGDFFYNVDFFELELLPNQAPTFDNSIANQNNAESDMINLDASASDPELGAITYMALGLPSGLSINSMGQISGTIDAGAASGGPSNNGEYNVIITATDDGSPQESTDLMFDWTVTAVPNEPPTIDPVSDVQASEGDALAIAVTVNDDTDPSASIVIYDKSVFGPNTDPFTSGAVVDPSDYSFTDGGSGAYTLSWNTASGDGRSYLARVTANDGVNPAVTIDFTIDISIPVVQVVPAKYFANPLPWYGNNPSGTLGRNVAIENTLAQNIGWIGSGEFVEYLVDIPASGIYLLNVYVANNSGAAANLGVSVGGNNIASIDITNNGDWQAYLEYSAFVTIPSGLQALRFDFTGGMNIRDFSFIPAFEITVGATTNGMIDPASNVQVEEGGSQTFNINPDVGFEIADVVVNGNSEGPISSYTFDNVAANGSISATFSAVAVVHTITATADANGSISPAGDISVIDGNNQMFTITPDPGYTISDVLVDGNSVGNPSSYEFINVTADAAINASFLLIPEPSCSNAVAYRINAGGPSGLGANGIFEEDQSTSSASGTASTGAPSQYYNTTPGDNTFGSNTAITNNTGYPDEIFMTERWLEGDQEWSFPANGTYSISLLFNENWSGEAGDPRVFDVVVEGNIVLDNYRPSVAAGAINTAIVETFNATVTDGTLNIDLIQDTQNPAIKGFDICFISGPANNAPVVNISTPADNSVFETAESVAFVGSATDTEDGTISSSLSWSSDLDGALGSGASFNTSSLTAGDHTITASVTDAGGLSSSATINLTINTPPTLSLTSPTNGSTVGRDVNVALEGTANDAEDGDISASISWSSSDAQANFSPTNGIGSSITTVLETPGTQSIMATVTDADGAMSTSSVNVTVAGPNVGFNAPSDGAIISGLTINVDLSASNIIFNNNEHFHFYINPPNLNMLSENNRISTASNIGATTFTFDENSGSMAINGGMGNGIVLGVNTIVVKVADANHNEFPNPEATAIVNFTTQAPVMLDAAFTAAPNPANCAALISFDANTSSGPATITTYEWDFDFDGTFAADQTGITTTNTYNSFGTKTVALRVTDSDMDTDIQTMDIDLTSTAPAADPGGPYTITIGDDLVLDGSASSDPDINPCADQLVSYTWDLDDDDSFDDAAVAEPTILASTLTSLGLGVGSHTISLLVEDSQGETNEASIGLTINSIPNTAPVIAVIADQTVDEESTLDLTNIVSITDADGDNLTVTISSVSDEPQMLQSNNNDKQTDPFPFDASGFLVESAVMNVPGSYTSTLTFDPTFGDGGGANGDGNGIYTITISVDDEDGNTITEDFVLTVNDIAQLVADTDTTRIEAESFDNQGPPNPGNGENGIGVEEDLGFTNIGFTHAGEFAEYEIDVETAGTYEFKFFVSKGSNTVNTMTINGGPASISPSMNNGWENYYEQITQVMLLEGPQTLRFDWTGDAGFMFNIDYFDITLLADVTPPVIVLNGENPIELLVGEPYVEAGATATDDTDGDLTSSIVITGTVDVNSPGTYMINYDVMDAAGNPAITTPRIINVTEMTQPCALVAIDPVGDDIQSASTFANGVIISNNSLGGVEITSVSIDLSTAMYPNMVFDPVGTAGDNTAKCLDIFAETGGDGNVGLTIPGDGGSGSDPDCTTPFSARVGNGGFSVMTLNFNDFQPGESVNFAVDIDPTSIKGFASAGNAGAIGGLELIGATVTVNFSDASSATGELYRTQPNSQDGSENYFYPAAECAAPGLSIVGVSPINTGTGFNEAIVNSSDITAQISGSQGDQVTLLVIESTIEDLGPGITPAAFEANKAEFIQEIDLVVGANGTIQTAVDLTPNASGNFYYLVAAKQRADDGICGVGTCSTSSVWRLKVEGEPQVLLEITPGTSIGGSTFGGDEKFQITNQSTGNLKITEISIDLSSGILPDMVFDPQGNGGDATAQCLEPNAASAVTVGLVTPTDACVDPYSQPRQGGFDVITMQFTDFNPTELFTFSTDIDPNSIQGVAGAGAAGSVSGLEVAGATLTVSFDDGSSLVSNLYEDGSFGGSQVVGPTVLSAPTISAVGTSSDQEIVFDPNQTMEIVGTPNAFYSLLQIDSRLFIASGDPPFNVADTTFYANELINKAIYNGQFDGSGSAQVPVTLLKTIGAVGTPSGGKNHFIAVQSDVPYATGQSVSATSNVVILKYDDAPPTADVTINVALQFRSDYGGEYAVKLYDPNDLITPVYDSVLTGNSAGDLLAPGIDTGAYVIAVKHPLFLQNVVTDINLSVGDNTINVGELTAGDSNNDNFVTALDFSVIVNSFNTQPGDANYDERADYNGDGFITSLDLSAIVNNFNTQGQNP